MQATSPDSLAAYAVIPEHLPAYVTTMSGATLHLHNGYAVYRAETTAIIIGYPTHTALPQLAEPATAAHHSLYNAHMVDASLSHVEKQKTPHAHEHTSLCRNANCLPHRTSPPLYKFHQTLMCEQLDALLTKVAQDKTIQQYILLTPLRPNGVPHHVAVKHTPDDWYSCLTLPFFTHQGEAPQQKLRSLLRRTSQEITVCCEPWSLACTELVENMISRHTLGEGTCHIFRHIAHYLDAAPNAVLFTARNTRNQTLEGFAVGDFTALTTAFYMFTFRRTTAPPGTADALLAALVREAEQRGHQQVNLGLGIHKGIASFKQKWGAIPFLPYEEYTWEPPRKAGFFSRFFSNTR